MQMYSRLSVEGGGDCQVGIDFGCDDHPVVGFSTANDWQEHVLCFHHARSEGFSEAEIVSVDSWDLSHFVFRPFESGDFHLQIDDFYFLPLDDDICGLGNPDAPAGACAASDWGTIVAHGNCATLNSYEFNPGDILFGSDGRSGFGLESAYYTFGSSESGLVSYFINPDAGGSHQSILATDVYGYGAGISAFLTSISCYDASVYEGIQFDARAPFPPGDVFVGFQTADSSSLYDCDTGISQCEVPYGVSTSLTDAWTTYTFGWGDFFQLGGASGPDFSPHRLLELVVRDPTDFGSPDPIPDWEVEIDNVRFFGGDDTSCNVYP
jgi:hypothetical protein